MKKITKITLIHAADLGRSDPDPYFSLSAFMLKIGTDDYHTKKQLLEHIEGDCNKRNDIVSAYKCFSGLISRLGMKRYKLPRDLKEFGDEAPNGFGFGCVSGIK